MTIQDAQDQYDNSPENAPQISKGTHYCSTHDRIERDSTCADAIALGEDDTQMTSAI